MTPSRCVCGRRFVGRDVAFGRQLLQREIDDVAERRAAAPASASASAPAPATPTIATPTSSPPLTALCNAVAANGGVRVNVTTAMRDAAATVLNADVMVEDVLQRLKCAAGAQSTLGGAAPLTSVGEALLTEARLVFIPKSGGVVQLRFVDAAPPRRTSETAPAIELARAAASTTGESRATINHEACLSLKKAETRPRLSLSLSRRSDAHSTGLVRQRARSRRRKLARVAVGAS